MKCPFCANCNSQVIESRSVEEGDAVRRRRECEKCSKRFTTYERTKRTSLWVIKKSGKREEFEKEKLKKGLLRAVEKRPVSISDVDRIVDQVEREMLRKKSEEVDSDKIGKAAMRRLKRIDKVAWLRFASVYLEFDELQDFEKEIERIESKKKK